MAKASNANGAETGVVKLKFGIDESASIQKIRTGLNQIIADLNKKPVKITLNIDTNATKAQIKDLTDALAQLKAVSSNAQQTINSANKSAPGGNSSAKALLAEYGTYYKNYTREVVSSGDNIAKADKQRKAAAARLKAGLEKCTAEERELLELKQKKIEFDNLDKLNQQQSLNKLKERINQFIKLNQLALNGTATGRKQLQQAQALAKTEFAPRGKYLDNQQVLKDAIFNFQKLAGEVDTSLTTVQKLEKQFKNKFGTSMAAIAIASITRAFRQLFNNVKNVDSALTQLAIVTGKSLGDLSGYAREAAASARELAVSITDLIESTTVYARLGYQMQDAAKFAEITTMYSRAGDVGVADATANITAMIKAFGVSADDLEGILDKVVKVGNNYAISSAEIGEAMNNAASSLSANNNTFEESLAILTAAQTTLQNISKSSTAVRTIAARISASSTELDELGEENALSSANLDKRMRAYGISIMDANGELRSTFDVLSDISQKWDELNTVERAAIAGMVAGVRQQSAFYSIVQNWDETKNIIDDCAESSGTLQEAQDKYFNSVEGQLTRLKSTWQSMSQSILNSDFAKVVLKVLNSLFTTINDALDKTGLMVIYTLGAMAAAFWIFKEKIVAYWREANTQIMKFSMVAIIASLLIHLNSLDEKSSGTALLITGIMAAVVAAVVIGCKIMGGSIKSLGTFIQALIAGTPILNIIALIIAAVTALAMGIKKLVQQRVEHNRKLAEEEENTRKKLEETAEAMKKVSDASLSAAKSVRELSEEFRNLGESASFDAWISTLKNVGQNINTILGKELSTADGIAELIGTTYDYDTLLTLPLEQRLSLLKQIELATANIAAQKAKEAYLAVSDIYSNDNTAADGRESFYFGDSNTYGDTKKKDVKSQNEMVYGLLHGLEGFDLGLLFNNKQLDISVNANSAKEYADIIQSAIDEFEAPGAKNIFGDIEKQPIYQWLLGELEKAKNDNIEEQKAINDILISKATSIGIGSNFSIDDAASYESAVKSIISALKSDETIASLLEGGLITAGNLEENAIDFIRTSFPEAFAKIVPAVSGVNIELKSFLSILNDIEGEYNAITSALDDMNKMGFLSSDTIASMLKDFPDLFDELIKNGIVQDDGGFYSIIGDADDIFVANIRKEYSDTINEVKDIYDNALKAYNDNQTAENAKNLLDAETNYINAVENAKTANAALNSLTLTNEIDKYVKGLEAQEDALQKQFETYQSIIDLRKELLDTYAAELEYQRELSKRNCTAIFPLFI